MYLVQLVNALLCLAPPVVEAPRCQFAIELKLVAPAAKEKCGDRCELAAPKVAWGDEAKVPVPVADPERCADSCPVGEIAEIWKRRGMVCGNADPEAFVAELQRLARSTPRREEAGLGPVVVGAWPEATRLFPSVVPDLADEADVVKRTYVQPTVTAHTDAPLARASALRSSATELETLADRLEHYGLYDRADELRGQAQKLRLDARRMLADAPHVAEPSYRKPPTKSYQHLREASPRVGEARNRKARE